MDYNDTPFVDPGQPRTCRHYEHMVAPLVNHMHGCEGLIVVEVSESCFGLWISVDRAGS